MQIYLGLGSNLGDRRENLRAAVRHLADKGLIIQRLSPVVESPAMLPHTSPSEWQRPFLNLVAECETDRSPQDLHGWIKEIQTALGRRDPARWSPRPIDIDILLWGREQIATVELTVPHPAITGRSFVLIPLIALRPDLTIPGLSDKTVLDWSRALTSHIPLWMGVLNVTPDSFSDGGRFWDWERLELHVRTMIDAGVHIIDVGGESTRPGAEAVAPSEEWSRIGAVLEALVARRRSDPLAPRVSVDTYHPETARRALELGVDMINDVSGLTTPEMLALARESGVDWIAMHQLSLPVDPAINLPEDRDPVQAVEEWLLAQLTAWDSAGLDLGRIIFDPGIGFGKTALQSLEIIRRASEFRRDGLRVLIGHSRKSFLKIFATDYDASRDLATVGVSMKLCEQGVDVIRVHNVPAHIAAHLGWAHAVSATVPDLRHDLK